MLAADECFFSIYGTLRRHAWLDEETAQENGHSLFDAYGTAMGWGGSSNPASDDVALWDLYDAGWNWSDDVADQADHLLWIQSGLTKRALRTGLPIAPMGQCATQVVQRIGIATIAGVQMLAPMRPAIPHEPEPYVHVLRPCDPHGAHRIRIEIDGGEDDTCVDNADRLAAGLNASNSWPNVLVMNALELAYGQEWLILEPPEMTRTGWLGTSAKRIVIDATVPEFSMDMSSFVLRQLSWHIRGIGVRSSVMITIRQA